jgi:hypothetical protein
MSFRKIHNTFWTDRDIEDRTPQYKYFYLYLLTNPRVNQLGIYEFSRKHASLETGYQVEAIDDLICQFEKTGKVKRSDISYEICLINFWLYNGSTNPKVITHCRTLYEKLKDPNLIYELKEFPIHLIIGDTLPIYHQTQEEEKEEEEKEEKEEEEKEEEESHLAGTLFPETQALIWPTFDDFWNAYDKKIDKLKSQNKWKKLKQSEKEAIMEFIPDYKMVQPDKQYRKDPSTFLNNKSWENELIGKKSGIQEIRNQHQRLKDWSHSQLD